MMARFCPWLAACPGFISGVWVDGAGWGVAEGTGVEVRVDLGVSVAVGNAVFFTEWRMEIGMLKLLVRQYKALEEAELD